MSWEIQYWEYGKCGDLPRLEALLDKYREAQDFVVAVHPETDWWIVVGKSDCERSRHEAETIVMVLNQLERAKSAVCQPNPELSTRSRAIALLDFLSWGKWIDLDEDETTDAIEAFEIFFNKCDPPIAKFITDQHDKRFVNWKQAFAAWRSAHDQSLGEEEILQEGYKQGWHDAHRNYLPLNEQDEK